ncbi:protein serine phosphatase with GAF(S) sensor(S) [Candidatus Moduliflexus flocculans]|uniref:Protein serine phosphatase with GAF(S) sensor(S) n=1 Tax=Candidatus Moduliflexus flocculans TaxID=1499966 RepID=A0A0S6VVQ0_9BACT|nr:protein serine phosphatase with GAF(S) sensor(S) [Candidatus Moduliflexus flocculans]
MGIIDTLLVPASFECLGQVREFILTSALNAGLSSKAAYRLQLGVDEILTNTIEYGYAGLDCEKLIWITVQEEAASVHVVLEDQGHPFDPRQHLTVENFDVPLETRNPGGLGIFLSMTSLDDLRYERGEGRNRISCVMNKESIHGEKPAEHILLVGACPSSATPLIETLKATGYMIATAATGEQALSRLFVNSIFDLVLISLHVPDIPIENLLEQWATNGMMQEIPVCALTSVAELSRAEACLRYGVADVLVYDVYSPNLWKHHIAQALQRQRMQAEVASSQTQLTILQKLADDLTQIILPVGIALSRIKNFDRLLERILRETKTVCNADGGTLYLRNDDLLNFAIMLNDSLGIAFNQSASKETMPAPLSLHDPTGEPNYENVATSSALSGQSINIPDIYHVVDFDFSGAKAFDAASGYRSMSMLTVPLKDYDGEVFGVLQLLNAQDSETGEVIPFTDYMQQAAEALASLASLVLSNRLLLERQKELLRMEEELHIGRQIQNTFLPATIPTIPGWEIAVSLQPAQEISGDFYDIFPLNDDQRLGFVIADVCDKGVGAALVMVLIRTLIRAFVEYSADSASSVRSVLEATNQYILKNHAKTTMFASLFIGMLNPYSGKLAYVNSGHPAPVIVNADGIRAELEPTGPVIGAFSDSTFAVRQATLAPGDTIFAFTDGVTDARDQAGNYFTRERLLALLQRFPNIPSRELLDRMNADVRSYTADAQQFDDITMIAIRRLP